MDAGNLTATLQDLRQGGERRPPLAQILPCRPACPGCIPDQSLDLALRLMRDCPFPAGGASRRCAAAGGSLSLDDILAAYRRASITKSSVRRISKTSGGSVRALAGGSAGPRLGRFTPLVLLVLPGED